MTLRDLLTDGTVYRVALSEMLSDYERERVLTDQFRIEQARINDEQEMLARMGGGIIVG